MLQYWRNFIIIGVGFVMGCTVTTPPVTAARPVWMENAQQKYPFKYYLTASGEGDTDQAAESVALGNLAKIFRSEINVDERLVERYFELIGDKNSYQENSQFDRNVTVNSSLTLLNVQYPEHYKDTKTGRVYALAVLNRASTAEIYVTRLKENNGQTERFVSRSEAQSPALRYAALSAAVAISADSQLLLEQLDVLMPSAKKQVSMTYMHDTLKNRLADAAKAIGFKVEIENDNQGKITQAVTALLTDLGFVVSSDDAFLCVRGSIMLEDTDLAREGLYFVRYLLKLNVVDVDKKTVAALNDRGREGHISKVEAENRCIKSMGDVIDRQLQRKVFAYFDSLVMQ